MARLATLQEADWVLPIDADDFGSVPALRCARSREAPADARALFVELVFFVQRRDVLVATPDCVASMRMWPPFAVGPVEEVSRMVRAEEIGWVEAAYVLEVHPAGPA